MKKAGILLTILALLLLVSTIYTFVAEMESLQFVTIPLFVLGLLCIGLGPAFIVFTLEAKRRKKIETRALIFSLLFIATGYFFKMQHWAGASLGLMIGVLINCFFYGSIAFKNKYEKWKVYARSTRDAFWLSLLDFLGIGSLVLGLLFKLLHWPGANIMATTGLVLVAGSMFAWNRKFKKEVVFRKETEDKLSESHKEIELQHRMLEEKQKEIIDSINYAKRIQRSHMATEIYIEKCLNRLKRS